MAEIQVGSVPESILLPLDGSKAADCAVPFARDIASRADLPVTVLHVFDTVRQLNSAATNDITWTRNAEPRATIAPQASIRNEVDELVTAKLDVSVVGRLGDAAEQIVGEAEEMAAPWIVMASLGASGIRRLLMGTTALHTVRSSRFPVLVVPARSSASEGFPESEVRIGVFLDGTSESEGSIPVAAAASRILNAQLDLVRVAETLEDEVAAGAIQSVDDDLSSSLRQQVEIYLDRIRDDCGAVGIRVKSVPLSGTPAVQMTNYVRTDKPALVAIATRRRSGIERWTYGSFAEQLMESLPTPMMLVPVEPGQRFALRAD